MRQHVKAVPAGPTSASRAWAIVVASLCAFVLSGALAGEASAVTRVVLAKIGPGGTNATTFSSPRQVAFNQTSKIAYVLDSGVNKIYAFDVSTPGVFSPLAGNFPLSVPASSLQRGIAVDNTALSSAGNLYYVAGNDQKIYGYTATGVPLAGFPVTVSVSPSEAISSVAVDSTGQILVFDRLAPHSIRRYNSTGVEGTPITVDISGASGDFTGTVRLAVDSNDDLYFSGNNGAVYKLTAASAYATRTEAAPSTPGVRGLAVDPVTHNLYVSQEGSFPDNRYIDARNSSGSPLYEFGKTVEEGTTHVYQGSAVDGSRDQIYAAETTRFKQMMVFGPPGSLPVAALDAESGLTGTHATLNGTVNPEGGAVTECKFEYLTQADYEANGNSYIGPKAPLTKSCEGSIPADSSPHPVSAALTNLKAQGTTYHYRLVAKSGFGSAGSADKTFVTPNIFFTGNASSVATSTATLTGSVNPDGVALTECKFEYGISTAYGSTVPCNPAAGSIPADSVPHPVSAALTGLSGNTTYHFRISVSSSLGTVVGVDQTFETLGVPQVVTQAISPVGRTGATLYAEVNPRGFNTNYRFDYGKTTAYGSQVPADIELFAGAGTLPIKGLAKLAGLQEGTTYHYRVVATSAVGTTHGPDQSFTTSSDPAACGNAALRAEQASDTLPSGSTELPACMALEMVSPIEKGQQPVRMSGIRQDASLSADGEHVLFRSNAALAGTEAVSDIAHGDVYLASRDEHGWATTPTILRQMRGDTAPSGFAPDLSSWFQIAAENANQNAEVISRAFRSGLDRTVTPFSPLLVTTEEPRAGGTFAGASADLSRLYISVGAGLSASPRRYSLDDPVPAPAGTARSNVYVASLGGDGQPEALQLLARDSLGKEWGGNCGVRVGGDLDLSIPQGQLDQRVHIQGAISEDGSRVYFSTRPAQPPSGDCSTANKMRILERTETPAGPVIDELVENECDRVVAPACDATDGDDNFQGASADGTKVYFITTRQLADSDLDSGTACGVDLGEATGCDLYLYDSALPAGSRLIQISAGDATNPTPGAGARVLNSIAGISTDGTHVYFTAEGVLTTAPNKLGARAQAGKPNLYLYERDSANPSGRTAFVGTLVPGDSAELWGREAAVGFGGPFGSSSVYPVPAMAAGGEEIGGDGHILLFKSRAQLTGNDTDGSRRDVYRYDSRTGSLQCISCLPGGDSAAADAKGAAEAGLAEGRPMGPAFASLGRWVSEDGNSVVFQTAAGLLPDDTNGIDDEYLWRDGQLQRLPGKDFPDAPTISGDGSSLAFRRAEPLLPQDGDSVADLYVARSGGGFPIPTVVPECVEEACQEPLRSQPVGLAAASEAPSPGNVREKPPVKCRKGFVRRNGKCVKRHPRKKHDRQKNRAAGNRQGGSK